MLTRKLVFLFLFSLFVGCVSSSHPKVADGNGADPQGESGSAPPSVTDKKTQDSDVSALVALTNNLQTEIVALKAQIGSMSTEVTLLKNQAGGDVNSTIALIIAIVACPLLIFLYAVSERFTPTRAVKDWLKGRLKYGTADSGRTWSGSAPKDEPHDTP